MEPVAALLVRMKPAIAKMGALIGGASLALRAIASVPKPFDANH